MIDHNFSISSLFCDAYIVESLKTSRTFLLGLNLYELKPYKQRYMAVLCIKLKIIYQTL